MAAGRDKVLGFGNGADQLDLSDFDFATVAAAKSHFADVGQDTVFTMGKDVLTLAGVDLTDISLADLLL